MADVNDVVSFGFGSWSAVAQLPTLGFGISLAVTAPGIEFYQPDHRLHAKAKDTRLHAYQPDKRIHLRSWGTDGS